MKTRVKKFPNGLTVLVSTDKKSLYSAVQFNYNIGSMYEEPEQSGISHFMEHMFFTGTKTRSITEIKKILNKYRADYNASTSKSATNFYVKTVSEYFDEPFKVYADMLSNPAFLPDQVERERGVILDEIEKSYDTPKKAFGREFYKEYFAGTPLYTNNIGSKETVSKFTSDDFIAFYNKYYIPTNCVISFAGNISYNKAIKLVKEHMSIAHNVSTSDFKSHNFYDNLYKRKKDYYIRTQNSSQANLIVTFPIPSILNELEPVSTKFRSLLSNRIRRVIRDENGLAYGLSVNISVYHFASILYFDISINDEKVEEILKILKKEIKEIKKNGFTKEEIDDYNFSLTVTLPLYNEGVLSVSSRALSHYELYKRFRKKGEYMKMLQKVTNEQLISFAKDYIITKNSFIGLLSKTLDKSIFKNFVL